MGKLENERHERFCLEYIKTLNAKQSYLIAYPESGEASAESSSIRLLGNDRVKARVQELMTELNSQKIASANEVLQLLTAIARGETTEEVVTSKGNIVTVESNTQARLKALELLAKRWGLLKDKVELSGNVGVTIIDDIPENDK